MCWCNCNSYCTKVPSDSFYSYNGQLTLDISFQIFHRPHNGTQIRLAIDRVRLLVSFSIDVESRVRIHRYCLGYSCHHLFS